MKHTLISFLVYICFLVSSGKDVFVTAPAGVFRGTLLSMQTQTFFGIPYAESVAGDKRWTHSQLKRPLREIWNATSFGAVCPQKKMVDTVPKSSEQSEDCLYLNIWAPTEGTNHDVMVFIHGGGFELGTGSDPLFSGFHLSRHTQTVVITINYRVGALGFLMTELGSNFGFRDQQIALQWIKQNIEFFGGNPNSVTISGQSAGAMSVLLHMISPSSEGLFHRCISESAPIGLRFSTPEEKKPVTKGLSVAAGCGAVNIECLKSKPVHALLAHQVSLWTQDIHVPMTTNRFLPWQPVIDGVLIPDQPMRLFEQGKFHAVPLIIGANKNESVPIEHFLTPVKNTTLLYDSIMSVVVSKDKEEVYRLYPIDRKGVLFSRKHEANRVANQILVDYGFACPSRYIAKLVSASSRDTPAFVYDFAYQVPHDPLNLTPECEYHSCHSAEIPFVFESPQLLSSHMRYHFSESELRLSRTMQKYWGSFITGDFSSERVGAWEDYNIANSKAMVFDIPTIKMGPYPRDVCDFWDDKGYTY